ncbi:MAG: hypothetical protein ABIH89_06665 [Elusimicrobiota bacterium]
MRDRFHIKEAEEAIYMPVIDTTVDLVHYHRIYTGNDVCERLIQSPAQFKEIFEYACCYNKKVTLLTPVCTESGLGRIKAIFDIAYKSGVEIEAAVNDMGIMNLLAEGYENIKPVMGRLNTIRFTLPYQSHHQFRLSNRINPKKRKKILDTQIFHEEYYDFFKEYGINRMEMDNRVSACLYADHLLKNGIYTTLYLPYTLISVTRRCLFASRKLASSVFALTGCNKECMGAKIYLKNKSGMTILARETAFYIQQDIKAEEVYPEYLKKIDRTVIFPEVF